jgi:uncharacterized protein YkwD
MRNFSSSGTITLALAAAAVLSAGTIPAAAQVAGESTCGAFVNRSPSTISSVTIRRQIRLGRGHPVHNTLICLINAERTSRGVPALRFDINLSQAAFLHVHEATRLKWWVAGANPHVNPESGPNTSNEAIPFRIKQGEYCKLGPITKTSEIAFTWAGSAGSRGEDSTPRGAVHWWMNISTSGHREVILDPAVKQFGTGYDGKVASRDVAPQREMASYVVDFAACGIPVPNPAKSPGDILKKNRPRPPL